MTKKAEIYYFTLTDEMLRKDKLAWFGNTKFKQIEFDKIIPDDKGNWLNLTDNDFESLMPLASKNINSLKTDKCIFEIYSNGIVTARDEWVYDFDKNNLIDKIKYFYNEYNVFLGKWNKEILKREINKLLSDELLNYSNVFIYNLSPKTKWSSRLRRDKLIKNRAAKFDDKNIINAVYRPYTKMFIYLDYIAIDIVGQQKEFFRNGLNNKAFFTSGMPHNKPFQVYASNIPYDFGALETTQGFALYHYDKEGSRHDNITDWALNEFKNHYVESKIAILDSLTKQDIFHYVYAVLHNPQYREKYELNLKREFPRIPYYENFAQWAEWGKQLMELHLDYETAKQYPLERHDTKQAKIPKAKLKADKANSVIILDDNTHLSGIPSQAWDYKLGNRSALEWVLDQYKEKKPKDPTIAEKFNTYRFADYKEQVIDLLMRVCTVSVETVRIIKSFND